MATPAAAGSCGKGFDQSTKCKVDTGDQAHVGQALIQADGNGRARLVAQGSTAPRCLDCVWRLVVACDPNTPLSPNDVLCTRAVASCQPGQILYDIYFSDTGVNGSYTRLATNCIGAATPVVSTTDVINALPQLDQDALGIPDPVFAVQPSGNAIVNLPVIVHGTAPTVPAKDFFGVLGFTVTVTPPRRATSGPSATATR